LWLADSLTGPWTHGTQKNVSGKTPDGQTWRDRFWAESVINFRCQKGNKFHTESVISDVGKLLPEIWQNLLTFYANRLTIEIKRNLLSEFDGKSVMETEQDLRCHWILPRLPLGTVHWCPFLVFKNLSRSLYNWNLSKLRHVIIISITIIYAYTY